MKYAQLVTTIALLAALTLPAPGFQVPGTDTPPLSELFPGPLAHADFGEVLAGEFTGDLQLDAIVMDGSEPKLAVAPEVFDCAIGTGVSASAIAVLSGVVPGKDLLLAADADGLQLLERDSAHGLWIVTTLFDATSGWADAVALAVGEIDGQDGSDVVAVSSAGDRILLAYGAGDGTFVEGAPIPLSGPPTYAMRLLNWRESGDVPGTDEIALASNLGVAVFEGDGSLLWSSTSGIHDLRLAVIRDVGSSVQRLALVGLVNGNDYLRLHGVGGSSASVNLGPAGVVAMSADDVDGDGDTELFLSVKSERKFWMLVNGSPSVPSFVPSAALKITYGSVYRDPAWNRAGLAIADFDSDGVTDVLAPAQGGQRPMGGVIQFVPSTLPLAHVGTTYQEQLRVGISGALFNTETSVLLLALAAPAMPIPEQGGELEMKVGVWHTEAFGQPIDPVAVLTTISPLPAPETLFHFEQLPPGYSPLTSPDVYTFVLRQVSVLDGVVVAEGPARTALLVSEANRSLVEGTEDTEVFIPMQVTPDSGSPRGGIGIGPSVPPPDEGDEPTDEAP